MTLEEYEDKLIELKLLLDNAKVRVAEKGAPQSEVDIAQAEFDYHLANKDTLVTE